MRTCLPEKLAAARVFDPFGPDEGLNGRFVLQGPCGSKLQLIAVDGTSTGWEQVTVSTDRRRCPNWLEMCFAKDLFWSEEECVVQYHPPLSQYVKNARWVLHLWKPLGQALPSPPASLIGVVGVGPHETQFFVNDFLAELYRIAGEAEKPSKAGGL